MDVGDVIDLGEKACKVIKELDSFNLKRPDTMKKRNEPYSSLEKALRILTSFTPVNREKGTGEISQEMDAHVSTVSRQLKVLTRHGFLQFNPRTKKYSLGKTCLDLGWAVRQTIRDQFVIIAQPFIDDLRDVLEKDVALEILIGESTILAYRAWGPQVNKIRFTMGERLPVHITAGARAIMAFSSADLVDDLLKGKLASITPKTITDADKLKKKLAEFNKEGIAYDIGESDLGFQFAAAPVFDYRKAPLAAIIFGEPIQGKKKGFDPKEIQLLKDTASKISHALHYRD
jgi:DNA-binding IclR family transcriptional regulator